MSVFPLVIIGAGPAGIAAAISAINRGFKSEEIIILEKSGEVASMIHSKYPDEKPILANYKGMIAECVGEMCVTDMSKDEFFNYLDEMVKKYKIQIFFHEQVTKITKFKNGQFNVETMQDTYTCNVVFVAIGNMAAPRTLGVAIDQSVSSRVHFDIQNIKTTDKSVLVVGGGDSAAEYCKILSDRKHEVTLSYRGSDFKSMLEQNRSQTEYLIKEGIINFLPGSIVEKIGANNLQPVVYFKENQYPELEVTNIVVALGADRPVNYLNSIGINTVMETGDFFSESKMAGLFFIGDLAAGKRGGSINFAFNSGVKAMGEACDMYLDCLKK